MPDISIDTVELEPQAALVVCRKVGMIDLSEALADMLPRVYRHIVGAGQQPAGMPFMRYFGMDGVTFDIAAGLPVGQSIDGTGDIEEHVLPGGRALTALHVGAYQDVGAVWSQVVQRARELGSDAMFGWDAYTNDPDEVAPEERETRVYLPL